MDNKLQKAIDLIEEAGGIVMMQSTEETEVMARESELLQQTAIEQNEKAKNKADYESRKVDAFEELNKALGSPNFSFVGIDNICYRNGIDLDDIEEYMFSHF